MKHALLSLALIAVGFWNSAPLSQAVEPDPQVVAQLQSGLKELQQNVAELQANIPPATRDYELLLADVRVFEKALDWMLRHNEFPRREYPAQALKALETGRARAAQLAAGNADWALRTGVTIRGYVSKVDSSVQPYALSLPAGVNPDAADRWPLHIKLHGRADGMNEVNFIARHEGKAVAKGQNWIQVDVFGRGNNAYRWAGEADVFEALADVRRRFRIDDHRITLHGFSMGGAGAWHLGLHHPGLWSSVGPGAGFVDFYKYQKQTQQLPEWQHATLGIYDAIDYSLNAFNVPICTYGGENDAQLVASTSVVKAAKSQGVDIKLLIGPGMGHKFHPNSLREFMAFHREKSAAGRQWNLGRQHIRFVTRTLKYNTCDWLTIQEVERVYAPSTVDAQRDDDGNVTISTQNVTALSLSRDVATLAIIDGDTLPCYDAGEGLLPDVYYSKTAEGWTVLSYDQSRAFQKNVEVNKRHNLQGPIDDAFMSAFVCVTGSGTAASPSHDEWVRFTRQRFESEFDQWMRGRVPVVADVDLDADTISRNHLILFGDPASNSVLKKILPDLPITWDNNSITVNGQTYSTQDHGLSMIFPNPLNPRRYVVINSGHTFHERDFKASNAWLFPRLGDIAVQKFTKQSDGNFEEQTVWATNFNSQWKLDDASN